MGRTKVKHELISDDSVRKVSFKKRRAGLLKKINELTTLCGVIACAVIFSDYNYCPNVWPSRSEAICVLEKLRTLPPRKQGKFMMDQESFLTISISKLNEKLGKQRKKNRRFELELVLADCMTGNNLHHLNSLKNLNDISHLLQEKIELISNRIENVMNNTE